MDVTGAAWRKSSYSGDNGGNCVEVANVWRKSSHSGDNGGDCVEVANVWRKSSHSGDNGGACIEVGTTGRAVAIRDSKDPAGPALAFAPRSWQAFADHLKSTT
jgi:hypothetical protein